MPNLPPLRQMFVLDTSLYERHLRRMLDKQKQFSDETVRGANRGAVAMRNMERAGNGVGMVMRRLSQLALGFATIMAAKFSIKNLLSLNATLEDSHIQFTTLLGDAKQADQVLQNIFKFTERTPFQFDDVKEGAKILLAFGTGVDELEDTLRRLGDIAAGTGSRLNDIARIYGKIRVNGIAQMMEVNQLQDKGIAIVERLAQAWGKTNLEVRKMIENAEVGFEDIKMVIGGMTDAGGQFAGGMDALSKSLNGMLSTAKDKLDALGRSLGGKLFEAVKDDVTSLLAAADELEKSGKLDEWAERVAIKIRAMYEGVKSATRWLVEHRQIIMRLLTVYATLKAAQIAVALSTAAWGAVTVGLNAALSAGKMVIIALQWAYAVLTRNVRLAANAQTALNVAFKASPWGVIATLILTAAAAIYTFAKRTDSAAEAQRKLASEIREATKEIESMTGAMLKQQQVELQAQRTSLVEENRAANNEARLLEDAIAEKKAAAANQINPRTGAIGVGSFDAGAETARLAELDKRRAEIGRELTINMVKQAAIGSQITGDIEKQIGFLEEENRLLSSNADMTKEQRDQFAQNAKKIAELQDVLDKRRQSTKKEGRTFGPDEKDISRAEQLVTATQNQLDRAAEMVHTNKQLHSTLKEIYDISDMIAKLEEQAASVKGTPQETRLNAKIAVMKEQRDHLQQQVADFKEFDSALTSALDSAQQLGEATLGIDVSQLDPAAMTAGVKAQVDAIQESVTKIADIELKLRVEGISDAEKASLNAQLDEVRDNAQKRTQELIDMIVDLPGIADEAKRALIELFDSFGKSGPELQQFQERIKSILEPFENQSLQLTIDAEGGAEVQAQLNRLKTETVDRLQAAFDALPEDIKKSNEGLRLMAEALRIVNKEAKDTQLSKFIGNVHAAANAMSEVANAIEMATGRTNTNLQKTAQLLDGIATGFSGIQTGLAQRTAAGHITAAGALGVIGGVAQVAGMLTGLIGMLANNDTRGQQAAEAMQRHREEMAEMIRMQEALHDAADKISSSIESLLQGSVVGENLARGDVLAIKDLIRIALEAVDRALNDPYAEFRDPNDPTDVFQPDQNAAQSAVYKFIDDLDKLGLGIDTEALREYMKEARAQGKSWTEILNDIINGADGLDFALQDLIDQYDRAAGAFAEGAEGIENRARFRQRFMGEDSATNLGSTLGDISGMEGLGSGFKDLIERIKGEDATTPEGMKAIQEMIREAMDRLAAGGASDLLGDMSPGDVMRLLEVLFGFTDGADEAADAAKTLSDAMAEAGRASSLVADLLGGSVADAFRAYVESLRANEATPEWIKELLPSGLDLSSPEGQQALSALIKDLAEQIAAGNYTPEEGQQLQSLLDALMGFLQQAENGGQVSRSVSSIQSLTDYTGTKMLMELSEIAYFARRGSDAAVDQLNVLRGLSELLSGDKMLGDGGGINFSKSSGQNIVVNVPVSYMEGVASQDIPKHISRLVEQKTRQVFGQSKSRLRR